MPPKSKYTAQEILDIAFNMVRCHGWTALSARAIADELKSSTMPIYAHFKSMENLEEEIIKKSLSLLLDYQTTIRTGDPVLDSGIGYVLFAKEEQHLFKGINDVKYSRLLLKYGQSNFDLLMGPLSRDPRVAAYTEDQHRQILFVQWVFIHGLAHLNNTILQDHFTHLEIPEVLAKANDIFMEGVNVFLKHGGTLPEGE